MGRSEAEITPCHGKRRKPRNKSIQSGMKWHLENSQELRKPSGHKKLLLTRPPGAPSGKASKVPGYRKFLRLTRLKNTSLFAWLSMAIVHPPNICPSRHKSLASSVPTPTQINISLTQGRRGRRLTIDSSDTNRHPTPPATRLHLFKAFFTSFIQSKPVQAQGQYL